MAHYAKVENGIVTEVIVAEQNFIDTLEDKELWFETSYNIKEGIYYNPNTGLPDEDQTFAKKTIGRRRKNYAGIGMTYDSELDMFLSPKPYESWILNKEFGRWDPPFEKPNDNKIYTWDESKKNWEYKGWYIKDGKSIKER